MNTIYTPTNLRRPRWPALLFKSLFAFCFFYVLLVTMMFW